MEGQTIKLKIFGDKTILKGKGGKLGVAKLGVAKRDESWLEFLTGTCGLTFDDWKEVRVRTREAGPRTFKIGGKVQNVNYGLTAKLDEKVGRFMAQYKAVRSEYSIYLIREGGNGRGRTPAPAAQGRRAVQPAVAGPSGSGYNLRRFAASALTPPTPGFCVRIASPPFRGDELFGGGGGGDSRSSVAVLAEYKPIVLEVHDEPFAGPYVSKEDEMGDADTVVLNPGSEEMDRSRGPVHERLERNVDRFTNGFLCKVKDELNNLKGGAGWARNERRAPLTSHLLEMLFKF